MRRLMAWLIAGLVMAGVIVVGNHVRRPRPQRLPLGHTSPPVQVVQPRVSLDRSDDLVDGQPVTVTVRGLDPRTDAEVTQCAEGPGPGTLLFFCTGLAHFTSMASSQPTTTEATPAGVIRQRSPRLPDTIATVTLTVHNPLRGPLGVYDASGRTVPDRTPPATVRCSTSSQVQQDGRSCLVVVRGHFAGGSVILPASVGFRSPLGTGAHHPGHHDPPAPPHR